MTPPTRLDDYQVQFRRTSFPLLCHCEEPTGDVAIRTISGAKHRPSPMETERERIATACGLAMTYGIGGRCFCFDPSGDSAWSALFAPTLQRTNKAPLRFRAGEPCSVYCVFSVKTTLNKSPSTTRSSRPD